jgi:glutamate transport system substrate-binding protein
MRVRHFGVAVAALAVATMSVSGCGAKKAGSVVDKAKNDKKLTIGVKFDQPSLGLKKPDGTVEGFDVDVAKYIAGKLGVQEKNITWKETISANRESFLKNGSDDLVVASYSITKARLPLITFGGPYLVPHQDILVRGNDTSIKTFADLKGKRVCQVSGSNSWKNLTEGTNKFNQKVAIKLVPANAYEECITKLKGGSLDAVSTDSTILAGYAAREGSSVKVDNVPFTDEKYGVGIKKGDTKTCTAVNKAITEMYTDGTAKQLIDKWFTPEHLQFDTSKPPAFQGCS